MYKKNRFKLDVFGIGTAIGGGAQAVGNVTGALIAKQATEYAADQAYQGQVAANNANIQMQREANLANQAISSGVNRTNIGLAREQNEFNLEMWNKQNEYNSPAHQMQLYREAGMNPNLVAGQFSPAQQLQSANLAVAQQPAPMQAAHIENPSAQAATIKQQGALAQAEYFKNLVGDTVQIAKGISEIGKIKKETKLTETDIRKTLADLDFVNKQSDWYDRLSEADLTNKLELAEQLRANVSLLTDQKEKVKAEAALHNFDLGIKRKFIDVLEKMPQAELDFLMSQMALNKAQSGLFGSQAALNRMVQDTGTQIPTVNSPVQQFLWDAYNFITDDGKKNIFKVLYDAATGTDGSDDDITVKDVVNVGRKIKAGAKTVKRIYKASTFKGPGGRAKHDPLPGSRSMP